MKAPKTPTDEQTQDKMSWKPGEIEWVKTPTPAVRKSAAQKIADRLKRGGSN